MDAKKITIATIALLALVTTHGIIIYKQLELWPYLTTNIIATLTLGTLLENLFNWEKRINRQTKELDRKAFELKISGKEIDEYLKETKKFHSIYQKVAKKNSLTKKLKCIVKNMDFTLSMGILKQIDNKKKNPNKNLPELKISKIQHKPLIVPGRQPQRKYTNKNSKHGS